MMLKKIARLFVIKTRFEALLVTYAIALGAVARGEAYLAKYPGMLGLVFFALCCGLPFLAGAKLLDSVRKKKVERAPLPISPRSRRTVYRARRHRRTSDRRHRLPSRHVA